MSTVYLLVLVLGCRLLEGQSVRVNGITLSGYEDRGGRENESQAENPTTEATTTTSTQQSCHPDIHSVLREMSAVLAELKVERRHTTTAVNNLESRLRASESQVEELKKKSEDLKNSLKITENNVEILNKENQEKKVVFSASLTDGELTYHGPYSTDVTVIYKYVFINIGKAYNPVTGIFTAPVRGVYEFKIYAHGNMGREVSVVLQKNGHHEIAAYANQNQHLASSSNGVSLLLEVGDVVCVKVRANAWIYDTTSHYNTFSGQMLFPV